MRAISLLICFWPGLPRLWLRGHWQGLATAIAFAGLLNVSLVMTYVWTGLLHPVISQAVWWLVGLVWIVSTWRGLRMLPHLGASWIEGPLDQDLFLRAQGEYLTGHWFEAESLTEQLLRQNPGDSDARLMLATLYRHAKRFEDAKHQLGLLQRYPGSEKWELEIAQERRLLACFADQEQLHHEESEPDEHMQSQDSIAEAA